MQYSDTIISRVVGGLFVALVAAACGAILVKAFLVQPYPETLLFQEKSLDTSSAATKRAGGIVVEEVAHGLEVPWSIVFTGRARMIVTERPGRVRVIENGALQKQPLHTFREVSSSGEEGLMGVALDPAYAVNKFIYFSLAYSSGGELYVKVVRLSDDSDRLTKPKIIIDRIPAAQYHAGSRILFGPDKELYITTGDATERKKAQDKKSLAGKILRIHGDGSIPRDNPIPNSPVWSFGHRNPQGISWSVDGKYLYSTEHGPSGSDGPGGGDEINRIVKEGNYGWPLISHSTKKRKGFVSPLSVFTPAEAPASALIYSSNAMPQFTGNFFFGALRGEGLMRAVIDPKNPDKILSVKKIPEVKFGRIRDVIQGPDGFIYFSTSNRDGRGSPTEKDDRLFRIRPTL